MAKLRLDLSQFKASGIYTLESDASESIILNTQTIRLVIGFSRKGPFNAPVYLPDKKSARNVFGDIDTFLENRGSYFHRSIYTCLEVGPIFALNLLPLNNDVDRGDKVPYQSFSIATTEPNGRKLWKLYSSFYNKERFWYPDQEYFLANVNSPGSINTGKLLNVVNLGQTPVSVIIKKSNVRQFDITAREWYNGNVPSYLHEQDFISDYFVDVIIIQNNWTDYLSLSVDPVFSEYFDRQGLKKGKLLEFINAPEVSIVGSFTGSIIPDLTDGSNVTHSIDVMVNQTIASTGIFISIDKEALDNYVHEEANEIDTDLVSAVDLIGHNFADPNRTNPDIINFLSYKTGIKENFGFNYKSEFTLSPTVPSIVGTSIALPEDWHTESLHLGKSYGYFNNVLCIPKPVTNQKDNVDLIKYYEYKNTLVPGESLVKLDSYEWITGDYSIGESEPFEGGMRGKWGKVEQIYEEVDTDGKTFLKIVYSHPNKRYEKPGTVVEFLPGVEGLTISTVDDTTSAMKFTINGSDLTTAQQNRLLVDTSTDDTIWPHAGEDVLVENLESKVWFYLKVKTDVTIEDNSAGYDDDVVTISVYDSEAMTTLKNNKLGYKLYFGSAANVQLEEKHADGDEFIVDVAPAFVAEPDIFEWVDATEFYASTSNPSEAKPNMLVSYKFNNLFKYYTDGALLPGDNLYYDTDKFWYLNYEVGKDTDGITVLYIKAYDTFINNQLGYYDEDDLEIDGKLTASPGTFSGWSIGSTSSILRDGGIGTDDVYIYGSPDDLYDDIKLIPNSWNPSKTTFQILPDYEANIQVGHYITSMEVDDEGTEHYKLTKVINKRRIYNMSIDSYAYEYTVNSSIYTFASGGFTYITRYIPIDDFIQHYQLFHLEGFKLTDYHLPGGLHKQQQLEKILGVLDPINSNLTEILSDKNVISFRYVVDTFDGGLAPMTYPKTYLTRLAKQRQKCLALMNMPSISEFIKSNDPRFTELPTPENPKPVLNTRYIADGGNLSLGPSFTFSLPDEFNGSKFAGYFSPYLIIRENGKNIKIPPAAHISNLYVQKFINGTPFHIVAGEKRGSISEPKMTGLEYDFLFKDREYIEPVGINPIIKKKGGKYIIYANQMAYQRTSSAFNNLHVRDLLITIEEAIEDMLEYYLFEFNNPTTRLEIKTRVETYLDGIRSNGGIYDFIVIMDEQNNTQEVIDRNIAILDIGIEPARGIHKFVNRITVLKTGGVSSGGFTL